MTSRAAPCKVGQASAANLSFLPKLCAFLSRALQEKKGRLFEKTQELRFSGYVRSRED